MHAYDVGVDAALMSFGFSKEARAPTALPQARKYQVPARATPPTASTAPAAAPKEAPLELVRSNYQGGYGTSGRMPGAVMGARGQVVGLPNKLAALFAH